MRHLTKTVILLFLLTLATATVAAETFQNEGLSLTAPAGWTSRQAEGTVMILMAPEKLSNFHPNVNVTIQQTGDMTDQQYLETSRAEIKKMNGSISNYKSIQFNDGSQGKALDSQFVYSGVNLTALSVWVMKDGKTYLITGTTTTADYPTRRPVFLEIARSFSAP